MLVGRVIDHLFGWRNWFGKHDLSLELSSLVPDVDSLDGTQASHL